MEFLTSFLAIALVWVFLFVCTLPGPLALKRGGAELFRVRPKNLRRRQFVLLANGGLFAAVVALWLVHMLNANRWPVLAVVYWAVLGGAVAIRVFRRFASGLAIHERGIFRPGKPFVPWRQIKFCKWKHEPGRLLIQFTTWNEDHAVPSEQADAVTDALGRFVEVRGTSGELRAAPERPPGESEAAPPQRPFQFSLGTLFLFVLAVAATASWFGLRHRIYREQWAAVAEFEAFEPQVSFRGLYVVTLDFSACPKTPADVDLAPLARLDKLEDLDLTDCPVTDAGLRHLAKLRRLDTLRLRGTAITDAGVEWLQELPRLHTVDLRNTNVTPEGRRRLEEAKPDLVVF